MPRIKVISFIENSALVCLTLSHWHLMHMWWHSRVHVARSTGSMCRLRVVLELHQELLVVFDLVVDVLLSLGVLLATERRGVLQVYPAVFAEKVRHISKI